MKGGYQILMIDPPWPKKKGGLRKVRPNQQRQIDYPVLSTNEIFMLLDKEILLQAETPHCIFMWTIEQFLLDCEKYMQERNYKRHCYSTICVNTKHLQKKVLRNK